MDLDYIKDRMLDNAKTLGIKIDDERDDQISFHCEIDARKYFKDSIYLRYTIFESGTLHLFLTFGKIEKTIANMELINAFNDETSWFKAYITNLNGNDYLELHYSALGIDQEETVVDTFNYLLTELLKDYTLKYLKPLIR